MNKSYIAIGSNLDDPIANVERAISLLANVDKLIARSSLYLTKPWGYLEQPDFINAVVLIETSCSPLALLGRVQALEKRMGRERTIHWGPRTIDLDILTFNDETINEPDLSIPHPHMFERAFVLGPLSEIDNSYLDAYLNLSADLREEIKRLELDPL